MNFTDSKNQSSSSAPRVAIIGAGFAGLTAAIKLSGEGADVTVFERSEGVGGVWRANDYPGAACDVPSFLYSWSFATKRDWSRRFAGQAEILAYIEDTVDRFRIRDRIEFGHELTSLDFDDSRSVWTLTFGDGHQHEADLVVAALGQMSIPAIPELPGIDTFAGSAFHTAEWRHDVDLAGRDVVVVGAGASAIQIVPELASIAASVSVVQRSPGYVLTKGELDYTFRQSPLSNRLARWRSYWSKELSTPRLVRWPRLVARAEKAYRRDLQNWVTDPELHKRVAPADRYGCKRILVSNDWYSALQRPGVSLHDSAVAEVAADHVLLADGTRLAADAIVYGTGFRTTSFFHGIPVRGAAGRVLDEEWRRTPSAYLGMTIPAFPNLFLMYGPNTNPAWNSVLVMLECQTRYMMDVVRKWRRSGPFVMDVLPEVSSRFRRLLAKRSARTIWVTGCSNWFTTKEGVNTQNWPALVSEYWLRTRRVRWSDYRVTRGPARTPGTESARAGSVAERVGG